jgi:phenylacetate-CoA ligase
MTYPYYFESFDYAEMRRTFALGETFHQGFARWPRAAIESHQDQLFMRCVARAWEIPFYQRLWGARGLTRADIRSLADITKLPIFGKSELMSSIAEHPPYGDYHGWDRWSPETRPVTAIHTTSGTTGRPQVVLFSPKSREVQALLVSRCWHMQGLRPGDVLHSVYGHGMINGGHFVREAALHYSNNLFLSAGTGKETRSATQIELMRDMKVTVIVGFVDYIRQLAETARAMAVLPGRDLCIRAIFGHVGRESRELLSRAWGGAAIYDWYGVADTGPIAAESLDQDGMYVMEDAQYLELVDSATGQAVSKGDSGDMVVTALYRDDVYPLIRFNTHDLTSWADGQSSLGWTLQRVTGVHGRSDNMVKLRGINVYPLALSGILSEHAAFAGEYVCRASRDPSSGRDQMLVVIETRADAIRDTTLAAEFAALLSRRVGIELSVELTAPGGTAALTQVDSRQKPIRLIDDRPKDRIL